MQTGQNVFDAADLVEEEALNAKSRHRVSRLSGPMGNAMGTHPVHPVDNAGHGATVCVVVLCLAQFVRRVQQVPNVFNVKGALDAK